LPPAGEIFLKTCLFVYAAKIGFSGEIARREAY
jgi:hypothetical protein